MILILNKVGFRLGHFWFMPLVSKIFYLLFMPIFKKEKLILDMAMLFKTVNQFLWLFKSLNKKRVSLNHMVAGYVKTFNIEANIFRDIHISLYKCQLTEIEKS